jgi:2'-5' RNA ligase
MRLFIALDLPAAVAGSLQDLLRRLRPSAKIQWIPPENLHITTKFIGEWPESRLAELKDALAGLPVGEPIKVHLHELGFFPNPRSPRIFWCGIEAPGLGELASATDDTTSALGVPRDKHPFLPHLTLARIKSPVTLDAFHIAIAALPSLDFGAFEARAFFLYQSVLQPAGSVYTKLAEFPLTKS